MASGAGHIPPSWSAPQRTPPRPSPDTQTPAQPPPAADPGQPRAAVARGLALFLGGFSLLNLLAELRSSFDANQWWISFDPLPDAVRRLALLAAAAALLAYAVVPRCSSWRRRATLSVIELLLIVACWNTVNYLAMIFRGRLSTPLPLPFALPVALTLLVVWRAVARRWPTDLRWPSLLAGAATLAACLIFFPVLQMLCFGLSDYTSRIRQADAIVVFGGGVDVDPTPSRALEDRVNRACDLYHAQAARSKVLPPKLIFLGSGADDPVMRRLALANQVDQADILTGSPGDNIFDSIVSSLPMLRPLQNRDLIQQPMVVIAVSHFYSLPRIKMAYQANGITVFTVPVRHSLVDSTYAMAREIPALWLYYLRQVVAGQ